jgi:hypothetical protein
VPSAVISTKCSVNSPLWIERSIGVRRKRWVKLIQVNLSDWSETRDISRDEGMGIGIEFG